MTTKDKFELINSTINKLNEGFLSTMKAKISFVTKGKGKYCLALVFRQKELSCESFHTYDDVLSALNFYTDIIARAIHERKLKNK
jgi:hypothetical protein